MQRFARLAGLLGAVVALVPAASASAATHQIRGTVVHKNAHTRSFVVASASGKLTKVFSRHSPAVGRTVRVSVRGRAAHLKATRIRAGSRHRRVKLRGTITYAGKTKFTLSAGGASIVIKTPRARTHTARNEAADQEQGDDDASDTSDSADTSDSETADEPPIGNEVIVVSKIDLSGDLEAVDTSDLGEHRGTIEIEGVIKSIDTVTRLVTVSADDCEQSGATITVQMFAGFDFSQIAVGQHVDAKLVRLEDGTYAVVEADVENGDDDTGDSAD